MYYLYVIQSERDKRYYLGYTSDLGKRLNSHNAGLQRWTRNKGPWKLVYSEFFINKRDAIIREKGLKNKKSHKAIENLIRNSGGDTRGYPAKAGLASPESVRDDTQGVIPIRNRDTAHSLK